ncbi:MAG TPA: hypothetical protein VN376_01320 [Longilinea sp.]|nr:hypothetical protein [Longilinea sp.]
MEMLAPVTHVIPLTTVRRARLLPTLGRVTVRADQKVNATDQVAIGSHSSRHLLMDVRKALGVPRSEKLDQFVDRKAGDHLQRGDIIAQTGGMFSRILRAPEDGDIISITNGQVLFEIGSSPFVLRAGISGTITQIFADRGVVIESAGALIQGAWGNGLIDQGVLTVITKAPDAELVRGAVDVSQRGGVVAFGTCQTEDSLKSIGEINLHGLILGSMAANLIPVALNLTFPVILLDGFGSHGMNAVAHKLLSSNEKRDICINTIEWNTFTGERPEIFIPLPAGAEEQQENVEFKVGQKVRVLMPPYAGQTGTILKIRPGMTSFITRIKAAAADVRLENQEEILMPLANMDVLE